MTQNYYCYVREPHGDFIIDGFGDKVLCFLNSSDFTKLLDNGFTIEVFACLDVPTTRSYLSRCLRTSHRIVNLILKHKHLPKQTLL